MTAPVPKPWIQGIAPYVAGRATTASGARAVKLSSNENPFGTGDAARAAYDAADRSLHVYPDAGAAALREAIGAHYGIDPDRVIHGTGSDEVLHLVAGAFAGVGDEVIYVRYGFSVYDIAARRVGATPMVAPDRNYGTDVDALLALVTPRTRVVYLANPNNPTGTYTSRAEIARIHAALPGDCLLVIDQAYTEYLDVADDDGALALADAAPNVLVTRTFSKIFGLAAERVGWGYAHPDIIGAMHRIRAPFAFSIAAGRAAIAALADDGFVAHSREENRRLRDWFAGEIENLRAAGLRAVPSKANFTLVLFEGKLAAEAAYRALLSAGYATRWLPGQGLPDALRITIGSEDQMRAVVDVLRPLAAAG